MRPPIEILKVELRIPLESDTFMASFSVPEN